MTDEPQNNAEPEAGIDTDELQDLDPFAGLSDEELDRMADEDEGDLVATNAPEGFRSGFVALVGRPNAGKSTLLNACLGSKVAITSPVAQTTRRRLRGVVNRDDCQIVFVDTPGLHKPQDSLGSELNRSALSELDDVDVVCLLIDATKPIGRGDAWVADRVKGSHAKKVLVLSKLDLATPEQVTSQLEAARSLMDFDDEIVTSATEGFNVEGFCDLVASYLPEGPRWFPLGMTTDETDEMMVAEFVREQVLLRTREEVPHAVGVSCDSIERKRKRDGDALVIDATIYVERAGQKGIIIGKRGEMIKRIGTDARQELQRIFGCPIFLDLRVEVHPDWRSDVREIHKLGYAADD